MIIFFVQAQKNNNQCVVISAKLPILLAKQAYYSIHIQCTFPPELLVHTIRGREELGEGRSGTDTESFCNLCFGSLYSFSSYTQRDGGASDGPQGCCGAPGI